MAYRFYGGTPDVVATDAAGNVATVKSNGDPIEFEVWSARTGGTQPPVKDAAGTTVTRVTPLTAGLDRGLILFQADAAGTDYVWLDRMDGTGRIRVGLRDAPNVSDKLDVATANSTYATHDAARRTGLSSADVVERERVAPSLNPIHAYAQPARFVLAQVGATLYAKWQIGAIPRLDVSTDNGKTWTSRGNFPAKIDYLYKAKSGTLIAIEGEKVAVAPSTPANPRVWRSTDDGTTWVESVGALAMNPLGSESISEGTDGSLMIAEYGALRPWFYRVRRSIDDGVTWSTPFQSDGRDPGSGDPGHIHSLTYDPIAGRHNVFLDYDITGTDGPQIWSSTDNGATWAMLGKSVNNGQPNFVTPMYFDNYIAWGSDNEINGRLSRLKRADFYAGNFAATEHIQQVSEKAIYGARAIRPGVYLVAVNGEHINSSYQAGLYSTMTEVYVVTNEGLTVSAGVSSYRTATAPGPLTGVRAQFPSRQYDDNDCGGLAWVNFPQGSPRSSYAAVPLTQGWEPPTQQVVLTATPNIMPGTTLSVQRTADPADVFDFITIPGTDQVTLGNTSLASTARGTIEYKANGDIEFRSNGTLVGKITAGVLLAWSRVDLAASGVGLRYGIGSPEGSVTARVGSLYLTDSGTDLLWQKVTGAGSTGWQPVRPPVDTAANFALATATVNTVGKFAGRQGFDATGGRPVWASGATATAPWKYADGTTAFTPA